MDVPGKFCHRKRLPIPSFAIRSAPSLLASVPEGVVDESDHRSRSQDKMASTTKQTRIHRFTQYLPQLNTNSKLKKDTRPLPALPKEAARLSGSSEPDTQHLPRGRVPTVEISPEPSTQSPPSSPPQYDLPPPQVNEIPSFDFDLPLLNTPPPYTESASKLQKHTRGHSDDTTNVSTQRLQKPSPSDQLSIPPPRSPTGHTHPEPGRSRGSLAPPTPQSEHGTRSVSSPVLGANRASSFLLSPEPPKGGQKVRKSWFGGHKSKNNSADLAETASTAWVNAGAAKIDYDIHILFNGDKVPELWNDAADTFVYLFPRESGRGPQFRVPSTVLWSSPLLMSMMQDDVVNGKFRTNIFDARPSAAIEDTTRNLALGDIGTPPHTPKLNPAADNQPYSESSGDSIRSSFDPRQYHLYFPTGVTSLGPEFGTDEVEQLVEVRNLLALLTGQPLIAIRSCPTNFHVFLALAAILRKFEFSNEDGSSFGPAVDASFSFILKDMPHLSDCRESRRTTIEALVLGEAMKSAELYNEAFAHAVGKWDECKVIKSPALDLISQTTRDRLEKAALDLKSRQRSVNERLTEFEFPSLFSGIGSSTSSDESKFVNFKSWRNNFINMRKQVLTYYKGVHGQWPPNASSKKNSFAEGGLNRLVLKGLYRDLCDLYDFLADREALTTRVYNGDGEEQSVRVSPISAALRRLLEEYDRSTPPVQPPIPFDVPLNPSVRTVEPSYGNMSPVAQHKAITRKFKDYELQLVLAKSHNLDADYKSSFLEMYKAFELREAKGKNAIQLSEQRHGHWTFLYACLQSLPLLTTDAPGLQYTDGVEYFLCQMPLGNLPWIEGQPQVEMTWFGVAGGQHIVSLPSDVVNHGVEATYRRSHCWTIAQKWIGSDADAPIVSHDDDLLPPLNPPPGFAGGELRDSVRSRQRSTSAGGNPQRPASAADSYRSANNSLRPSTAHNPRIRSSSRQSARQSIALGLERIPLDPEAIHNFPPRPVSRSVSPAPYSRQWNGSAPNLSTPEVQTERRGSTFDDILGTNKENKKKEKKGKKVTKGKK